MASELVMGIDGGGSTVRVVITTRALDVVASSRILAGCNPSGRGRDPAADALRQAMVAALADGGLAPDDVAAVGIGVAGAAEPGWRGWLRETVASVLPDTLVRLSGDHEIALAGARGERLGLIAIAGTGTAIYGVNAAGEARLVGGWGYQLADEGSGFWLGREAIRAVLTAHDFKTAPTALTDALLGHLRRSTPRDLIVWVYEEGPTGPERMASLAPLVLGCAAEGDPVAREIVERGAASLANDILAAIDLLGLERDTIAFAGGLLESPTPLRAALCARLGVDPPPPRYSPAVGAALLAVNALDDARSRG